MNRRFNRHLACFHYGKKGFTLIELLVVIAVLGALVAVAIPAIAPFIGRGETEAADTELDNVRIAVTAAMVNSDKEDKAVVAYMIATGIEADPTLDTLNDPARYLLNNTEYNYTITSAGIVNRPGDKATSWTNGGS